MADSCSSEIGSTIAVPPPLPSRWHAVKLAGLWFAGTLALVWLAGVIQQRSIPMPACNFRLVVGIPCPGCGGTRAFAALAGGDVRRALAMNPLAVVGALAALAAFPLTALDTRLADGWGTRLVRRTVRGRVLRWGLAALVIANWAYLIFEGR